MGRYQIVIDRDACIGAGNCVSIDPQNFSLPPGGDGKVHVAVAVIDDSRLALTMEAAKNCPTTAIHIVNMDTGQYLI